MGTYQNSPSNQTQNGSNENNQHSAAPATETVTNNENSNIMEEVNLNSSEDAQQQGVNVTAPEAGGTKFEAGEEVPSGTDLGSSESPHYPPRPL